MSYLVVKKRKSRKRAHVNLRKVKIFKIFGLEKRFIEEKYVKKDCIVIIGGRGTGKTRELKKLQKYSVELWGTSAILLNAKRIKEKDKIEKDKVYLIDDIDTLDKTLDRPKINKLKEIIQDAHAVVVTAENLKKVDSGIQRALRSRQRLRSGESLKYVDLGGTEEEVKDIGIILIIFLILGAGLIYGIHDAFILGLLLRYMTIEWRWLER